MVTRSRYAERMSKTWTPKKDTVELAPSRIRRDPVPIEKAADAAKRVYWDPSEWETRFVIAGVVMFALALSTAIIGISHMTS